MTDPMGVGRNFTEILRVIDALQLGHKHSSATPADWTSGSQDIFPPGITNEQSKDLFPQSWDEIRPCLRMTQVRVRSYPAQPLSLRTGAVIGTPGTHGDDRTRGP